MRIVMIFETFSEKRDFSKNSNFDNQKPHPNIHFFPRTYPISKLSPPHLSVMKPMSHQKILRKESVIFAIGCLWTFSLGNCIPLMMAWSRLGYHPQHRVCVCFDGSFSLYFVIGPVIIGHALPHLLTSYCYFVIIRTLRRSGKRAMRRSSTVSTVSSENNLDGEKRQIFSEKLTKLETKTDTKTNPKSEIKTAKTDRHSDDLKNFSRRSSSMSSISTIGLVTWSDTEKQVLYGNLIIVIFFSICWVPYSFLIIMGDSANIKLKRVFAGLCLISFSINGWVYGLISQRFRSGYRKTLKWCFGGIFDCVFNANRMKFETSLNNCGKTGVDTGVGSKVGSEFGSPTSFKPDKTSTPVQLSRSAKNALNAVDTGAFLIDFFSGPFFEKNDKYLSRR